MIVYSKLSGIKVDNLHPYAPLNNTVDQDASLHTMECGRLSLARVEHRAFCFTLACVYAPADTSKSRVEFFSMLQKKLLEQEGPFIMAGDWNCVLDPGDYKSSTGKEKKLLPDSKALQSLCDALDVQDAYRIHHPSAPFWTIIRENGFQARLDRIYVSNDMVNQCPVADHVLSFRSKSSVSDHVYGPFIDLQPSNMANRGKQPYRLNPAHLQHKHFDEMLSNAISCFSCIKDSPHLVQEWSTLKCNVRDAGEQYARKLKRQTTLALRKARRQRAALHASVASNTADQATKRKFYDAVQVETLNAVNKAERANAQTKLRYQKLAENGKFAYKQFKAPRTTSDILCLKNKDGVEVSDPAAIPDVACEAMKELYTADTTTKDAQDFLLNHITQSLDAQAANSLEQQITEDEVMESISSMKGATSPGPDGIGIAFYKRYKVALVPILTRVYNLLLASTSIPAWFTAGNVILLFKKGDPKLSSNYRPITLLNLDYKIMTKVLSKRLQKALPPVLGSTQYAFLPNRCAQDNAMALQLTIQSANHENNLSKALLVFLDMEKAYDRVDHGWLWATLQKVGVSALFINWIKSIYANSASTITVNGHASTPFSIGRGVRQGDALSCQLFLVAIHPLQATINAKLQGLPVSPSNPTTTPACLQFADDTIAVVYPEEAEDFLSILDAYSKASNARINANKSLILPLNDADPTALPFPVVPPGETVRHIGFPFDAKGVASADHVYPAKIEAAKKKVALWSVQGIPSLQMRVRLFNSLVLSTFRFVAYLVPPRPQDIKEIDSLQRRFLWKNKKVGNVKKEICALPPSEGGLGLTNCKTTFQLTSFYWIRRLYTHDGPWQQLFWHHVEHLRLSEGTLSRLVDPFRQNMQGVALPSPWNVYLAEWKKNGGVTSVPSSFEGLLSLPIKENTLFKFSIRSATTRKAAATYPAPLLVGDCWDPVNGVWRWPVHHSHDPETSLHRLYATDLLRALIAPWIDLPSTRSSHPVLETLAHQPHLASTRSGPREQPWPFSSFSHKQVGKRILASLVKADPSYHSGLVELLRPLGADVAPSTLWTMLKSKWTNRQAVDLNYKCIHNGLYVGGRLAHAAQDQRLRYCSACPEVENSHTHLFIECPQVRNCWTDLFHLAYSLWPQIKWKYGYNWPAFLLNLPLQEPRSKYQQEMWHAMVGDMKLAIYYSFQAFTWDDKPFTDKVIMKHFLIRLSTLIQTQFLNAQQEPRLLEQFKSTWCSTGRVTIQPSGFPSIRI